MYRGLIRIAIACWFGGIAFAAVAAFAEHVVLDNGLELDGELGAIKTLGDFETPADVGSRKIVIVDDGLRRTYFNKELLAVNPQPSIATPQVINIDQPVSTSPNRIATVGRIAFSTPFNANGRRIIGLPTANGVQEIIQGITKITPVYCVVEGLGGKTVNVNWQSRVATNSIPREVLSAIIRKQIDRSNPNERLQVVSLLIEAERFQDAALELEEIIQDFPDLSDKRKLADKLKQEYARQLVGIIRRADKQGQYEAVKSMIRQFPSDGIAGEILSSVLEIKQDHDKKLAQLDSLKGQLNELVGNLKNAKLVPEDSTAEFDLIIEEINRELNIQNSPRLAGFLRLLGDGSHTVDEKVAFAIQGWLMGEAGATGNLAVALSLVKARAQLIVYLKSKLPHEKEQALTAIAGLEGATVANLARIAANLKPWEFPDEQSKIRENEFRIAGKNGTRDFSYLVRLPPEYDPYRKYPVVVSMNGNATIEQQLDWWCGSYEERFGARIGPAMQHGYIVIVPEWQHSGQVAYKFSPQEHSKVLDALRDAQARFSIDTDRVFLAGHSLGGDAAWDLALAHPDLWAGCIMVSAKCSRYNIHYWENAKNGPALYFVMGEYDETHLKDNQVQWNRYISAKECDMILVGYQGRGHEDFYEEIHRMFEWMNMQQRDFSPKKIDCVSMRPWDNFFWWLEVADLPQANIVLPAVAEGEYPPKGFKMPAKIEGEIRAPNDFKITVSSRMATLWLNPDLADFEKPIEINFKTKSAKQTIQPAVDVLLEDLRTRRDRQHPFWAKIELGS